MKENTIKLNTNIKYAHVNCISCGEYIGEFGDSDSLTDNDDSLIMLKVNKDICPKCGSNTVEITAFLDISID